MLHRTLGNDANTEMSDSVFRLMQRGTERLLKPLMRGMHKLIVERAKISKVQDKDTSFPPAITKNALVHSRLPPRNTRAHSIRRLLRKDFRPPALQKYTSQEHGNDDYTHYIHSTTRRINRCVYRHRKSCTATALRQRSIAPANRKVHRTGALARTRGSPPQKEDG